MQTTAESQTATGILFLRGFRASHLAERPEGVYTAWADRNGQRKVSLRTPEGRTTVFGAEVSTDGTLTIHKETVEVSAGDAVRFMEARNG